MKRSYTACSDLLSLTARSFEVIYRPGEKPVHGAYPGCRSTLPEVKQGRSNHIHAYYRKEYIATVLAGKALNDSGLVRVEYRFLCYSWIDGDTAWEEHCSGHLDTFKTTKRVGRPRPEGGPLLSGSRLPRQIPPTCPAADRGLSVKTCLSCQHHHRHAFIPTAIQSASGQSRSAVVERDSTVVHAVSSQAFHDNFSCRNQHVVNKSIMVERTSTHVRNLTLFSKF